MLLMILTKINKSCHESCHEITEPLIFQGFWNLVLWVQVPSPAPDNDNPNPVPIGDGFGFLVYL